MRARSWTIGALLAAGALLVGACQTTGGAASGPPCAERPIADWVDGAGTCLSLATFGAADAGPAPTLVVLLHGDVSRGGAADYHVPYAEQIGSRAGTIAVALVRPGYPDGRGTASGGSHSGRRDHYTDENNRVVAEAIAALKRVHDPARTVILAHSGGSAQAGTIIGRYPGLADAALLVSCPCDVPRWRRMKNRSAWTRSQSPQEFADSVAAATQVVAVTGANDGNTDPVLAQDYIAALAARGLDARFVEAPGASHSFSTLWPTVEEELSSVLDKPGAS